MIAFSDLRGCPNLTMPDFTFAEAAAWFTDSAQEFEDDFRSAEERTVDDLHNTAVELSSGSLTPADLRRMDHPYAKRHGTPKLNPGIINAQSGDFRGAWERDAVKPARDGLTSGIFNTDPKAEKWLQPGTKFMVARPVDAEIEDRVAPRREGRIEHALDKLTS